MNALVPVKQQEVTFYEDVILVARLADGQILIPLRPIIERLDLDWASQTRRINRDPILNEEQKRVVITTTDSRHGAMPREMLCIPLDFLSGFLFGINADRVRPELRDRVIRYQRECYKALANAFEEGSLTSEPAFSELLESDSPAAQAYKMIRAMMELARNQLLLEARMDSHDARLEQHERRLEVVESTLGDPGRHVTPEQASQISQAVKAIAMKLSDRSGRNEYGGVYGELYRRFGIASYKELPAGRFDAAMDFLNDWHARLAGKEAF